MFKSFRISLTSSRRPESAWICVISREESLVFVTRPSSSYCIVSLSLHLSSIVRIILDLVKEHGKDAEEMKATMKSVSVLQRCELTVVLLFPKK